MQRVSAISAFAAAALHFAVLILLAFTTNAAEPGLVDAWHAPLSLHAWPIPLVTAIALLGLINHPATNDVQVSAWGGGVLLCLSAWILWIAATVGLSILAGEGRPEGFLVVWLAPSPAFVVGGAAAALVGQKLSARGHAPKWLPMVGALTLLFGLGCLFSIFAVYLAMLSFAVWWAGLGIALSASSNPQVVAS